ncbi:hypothetical protein CQW23_25270 [Capsicum baccatum]|uniref:Tetratricopeptide repeat protein 5 OB fold domain-containing protein n=1 Tax=Capsicum baccatum TaxID=33114 RepID=A0A2G2VKI0_CAPBA|nr:hypothetical protein CQW23_25270 [Capsicum baccatum]
MENGAEFGNYVNGLSLKKMKVAVLDEIDAEMEENLDKPEHISDVFIAPDHCNSEAAVSIPLPDEIDDEMEEDSDKPEDVNDVSIALDRNNFEGQIKAKRLSSLSSSLATVDLSHSYKRVTMDLLSEGLNKGIAITGKVLFFAKNESLAPLCYVLSDASHTCYVIWYTQ